jgi:thiamine pyrophosphate-dependent acetolactate synthase large subunit-like protein
VREVAGFSPDLVLEMVRALEKTASELLQAIEEARRVALRVGRRCLESSAMKEISRRAALRRMEKA